uniref:Uncharacterized protein n=1 Tax=uncultured Chloroflexota bacterium TaxID=166587 RepID=H5SPH6_9CHLR|nr:hypothetical protein HGMM_F54B02C27 [uncultured Chloroflexota bacterium]
MESPASHPSSPQGGLPAPAASVSNRCRRDGRRTYGVGWNPPPPIHQARKAGFRRLRRRFPTDAAAMAAAPPSGDGIPRLASIKPAERAFYPAASVSNRCRSDGRRTYGVGWNPPPPIHQARKAGFRRLRRRFLTDAAAMAAAPMAWDRIPRLASIKPAERAFYPAASVSNRCRRDGRRASVGG